MKNAFEKTFPRIIESVMLVLVAAGTCSASPFSIIRFGPDLTRAGRWEEARDLLIRNRYVCDEAWFSTGGNTSTLDWHRKNAAVQAKAAAELRAVGIVPSLQVQETVGHGEAMKGLAKPSHCTWTGFTGPDGYEAGRCWCPRDPALHAYFAEIGRIYAAWKPGSVWIDDDLRIDRHGVVTTGCFCRRCIQAFADKENRAYTRESLVAALKCDDALRRRWKEHGFEGLAQLAAAIARAVHEVSPETRLGLQYPWCDKEQLLICEAMSAATGARIGVRPGCGAYSDRNPFDQVDKTYRIARQMKSLSSHAELFDQICPEIETCPRVFSSRTPRSLAFEALIHLAQGCDSLSWYMIGEEAPGDFDTLVFPALRENMELYKAYVRLNEGTVPCGYDVPDMGDSPTAPDWPVRYSATGVPFAFGHGRKLGMAIPASFAEKLPDEQLRRCFAGAMVTDMKAVGILQKRGLLSAHIKGPGCYSLPEGGRLGVSPSLCPDEADSAELVRYGERANWAAKGGFPARLLDPCLAATWCRTKPDGTFASLVVLNTRIDEQRPVRVRLHKFTGDLVRWFPLWGTSEILTPTRDGNGDVIVTIPPVAAWSGGFIAPVPNVCVDRKEPAFDTLICHRGESKDAPENTLPAYRMAVDRGFGFECDIYMSTDKRLFTFHDRSLERTTGGVHKEKCIDANWSDMVSKLNAGGWGQWKGSPFDPTRPALLEEVLELARDGRYIYIEVKENDPSWVPHIKAVLGGQRKATPKNVLFITFGDKVCAELKRQMPEYKAYLLTGARRGRSNAAKPITVEYVLSKLKETGADGVDCQFNPEIITENFIRAIKEAGYEFHVWTIDDLEMAKLAFSRGAQTVTTNCAKYILDAYMDDRQNNPGFSQSDVSAVHDAKK